MGTFGAWHSTHPKVSLIIMSPEIDQEDSAGFKRIRKGYRPHGRRRLLSPEPADSGWILPSLSREPLLLVLGIGV